MVAKNPEMIPISNFYTDTAYTAVSVMQYVSMYEYQY